MDIDNTLPVVSVIVLTYNHFENIDKNLNSIFEQDYPNIQIVVCDDASEEFPREWIAGILSTAKIKQGYVIEQNEKNLGTVRNYNKAITLARGDIIVPLSQDDIFSGPHCISDIVDFFQNSECSVCTAKYKGAVSGTVLPRPCEVELFEKDDGRILLRTLMGNFISGSVLYLDRRKATFGEKLFDEEYVLIEDYPFVLKHLLAHQPIGFLDKVMIFYGESGITCRKGGLSPTFLEDLIRLYEKVILPNAERLCHTVLKKYIYCLYLDIMDLYQESTGHKRGNTAKKYVFRNPDLFLLMLKLFLTLKIGDRENGKRNYYNYYKVLYKLGLPEG